MTQRPSEVVARALSAQAQDRRSRASVYLNASVAGAAGQGRWLSEVGFLASVQVTYAAIDPSNYEPSGDEEGREISALYFVPYGLARDAELLSGDAPRRFRTRRSPGAVGTAPFPGDPGYSGASDLGEDSSCAIKTLGVLAAMRQSNGGPGFHAVVTRAGDVSICGPADVHVSPVEGSENAFVVAVEVAVRRAEDGTLSEAPWTLAQLDALSVVTSKLHAAYPSLLLDTDKGVRLVERDERPDGLGAWFTGDNLASFIQLVADQGAFDAATEVFRRSPPPQGRRAEAQVAIGTADTAGEASMVLAAYVDLAAAARSHGVSELSRENVFVERARVSHLEGAEGAEAAAHAEAATQMTPLFPQVTRFEPHVYNFATGLWGDETPG